MDKLYNIQQLKEWTADKILVLDISKAIKLLSEIEQFSDDIIIWKLKAENNIQLKYTTMEKPTESKRQEDYHFVFYHGNGEQDDPIQID